jgi:hypothetical protein
LKNILIDEKFLSKTMNWDYFLEIMKTLPKESHDVIKKNLEKISPSEFLKMNENSYKKIEKEILDSVEQRFHIFVSLELGRIRNYLQDFESDN